MGQWAVSITGYDTSGPGVTTKVYAMGPGIAFTDAAYAPSAVVSWKSSNQKVDVAKEGGVTLSADAGQLVLENLPSDIGLAGPLDSLLNWSWQNRVALLYWISDGTWANRQLVDVACLQQPVATLPSPNNAAATITFPLRDPRAGLDVPLQPTKFAGSNTGGTGIEGEADITGKPKPILYGTVSNIPGVRVNASLLIYQVADVAATILCVRDGGAGLTAGTARGSLASLLSSTPTPGTYDTYAGSEGTFVRLGTTPVFQIAIDAQEGSSGSNRTNLALQSQDFTSASWTKTNATVTANSILAPDGSLTGDTVVATGANASVLQQYTAGALPGRTFSHAVFLRAGNVTKPIRVRCQSSNGATIADFTVTPSPSYWTRVPVTALMGAGADTVVNFSITMPTSVNTDTFYVWGDQLEEAAAPTQYIPTTTVAVTAPGMSGRTHAQIWSRFRQARCRNVSGDLNAASVTACDAIDNNEVGFWWAEETTCLDAMNEILTSLSGYEVQGFDLKWSINKLVAPSGTTLLDFVLVSPTSQLTSKNRAIASIMRTRAGFAPDGAPPCQVSVNWGRNYQVFSEADFAGVAPQRLRDKFKLQYRSVIAADTSIWNPAASSGPWLNAPLLAVNTSYQPGSDGLTAPHAVAEAGRLEALYGANKPQYQIAFVPKVTDQVSVGAVVSLAHPQMGLSGGPLFIVLQSALSVDSETPIMTLVLGFQT